MSAEHDYTAPAPLRDTNLERALDSARELRHPTASPSPRVALWVSVIATLMLILGLGYALATEFDREAPTRPAPDEAPVSALTFPS